MSEPAKSPAPPEHAAARREHRDGIAWITLDDPAKKVNTLSFGLMAWFEEQLEELEKDPPKGVVIRSGKPGAFIAGADIEELKALKDPSEVRELLSRGHALCRRLEGLSFPVVAAIDGACLGGGLELALACHLRVASESPKTKLGLPEVQLGLYPGLGGTQRLPRLVGVVDALPMILTGKQVDARRARRMGLVHESCHAADLEEAARRLIARGKARAPKPRKKPFGTRVANLLAALPGLKGVVYGKAEKEILRTTGGHYPAPLAALDTVQRGMATSLDRGLAIEAEGFSKLVVSEVAKRLMGIFFMKTEADGQAARTAKASRALDRVGVLGAGFMGAGIVQVLAHKGYHVVMKDRDHAALGRGLKQCRDLFSGLVKRRRYKPMDLTLAMGRIVPTVDYHGFGQTEFVVEAVFEDVGVKHQVIREVEEAAPENLIFASNTSTIPIARLAEASRRKENFVGMHFFSPVHKMPLLEIIKIPETSEETLATTVEVGRRMGKTIIVVNDGPGFFTSRVLGPFIAEAGWILAQGARVEAVDRVLTRWGWPVGPITLLDEVGIDIARHAGTVMHEALGERMQPPQVFESLIEDGRTGRKGGEGFYRYEGGKKQGVDESIYPMIGWQPADIPEEEIVERCWMRMLNEVAFSMEDGVIEEPRDIEIGVIFGFGFPPFRGGILHEADRLGLDHVVGRLETYAEKYGQRFAPAQLLRDMAAKGARFHG